MKAQVKKISAVMAFVCVFAAQAEDVVESANVFGLMAVNSGTANTIVATPWMSATGEGSVVVSNIVKTTNLTVGDKLYVINGNGEDAFYEGWALQSGNYWGSIGKFTLNTDGTMSAAVSADPQHKTIVRGQGVWLVRNDPSVPFYLYGQYTNVAATTTITAGSENSPVWHLVGNASASDFVINSKITANVNSKDTIVIPTGNAPRILTWNGANWGDDTATTNGVIGNKTFQFPCRDTNQSVPAGTGFWYVSRGGYPTITW